MCNKGSHHPFLTPGHDIGQHATFSQQSFCTDHDEVEVPIPWCLFDTVLWLPGRCTPGHTNTTTVTNEVGDHSHGPHLSFPPPPKVNMSGATPFPFPDPRCRGKLHVETPTLVSRKTHENLFHFNPLLFFIIRKQPWPSLCNIVCKTMLRRRRATSNHHSGPH